MGKYAGRHVVPVIIFARAGPHQWHKSVIKEKAEPRYEAGKNSLYRINTLTVQLHENYIHISYR